MIVNWYLKIGNLNNMFKQQLAAQLITALKSKDATRVSTLRLLISAIKNEEIAGKKREQGLTDDEVITIISRQIKQRRDSIAQYLAGNRADLVAREESELKILQEFMPTQMSADEIREIVKQVIATGAANMGAVMGQVMSRVKGQADGTAVRKMVEEALNG